MLSQTPPKGPSPELPLRAVFFKGDDSPGILSDLLRFRKTELVETLGWDLTVIQDVEKDEYDTPNTVYCAVFRGAKIISGFRAIRTDQPYLSKDKFGWLADGGEFPTTENCWEISRFVVAEKSRQFDAVLRTYAAMFHFAIGTGARSLVAFTDLSHERLLQRIGITTKRFGPPSQIGTDAYGRPIIVVAGEIPVAEQSGVRFEKLISMTEEMEINDAVSVFRPARLSA